MSKHQALIDAPESGAALPDIEAAAKVLAAKMDYPWEYMPEQGRQSMRENAKAVIYAAKTPAVRALLADLERAEKALNRIASWPEGEQVTPSFDEPNAANIARDYLSGITDADGAQTSPIPCDVFSGGSLFKKGTPICDLAEHIDTEAARLVWAMANMGMSNDHSRNFTTHVLRVGGIGDIHDCRTYIDAALAQMAGG